MPVDFFESRCKSQSNDITFGLCDDPPPPHRPAYINNGNVADWIGIVHNPSKIDVDYYAVDNCKILLRDDGKQASSCDGFLHYEGKIIFTELKIRESGQWVKKGREQITSTIKHFPNLADTHIEAYVCNKLRPSVNVDHAFQTAIFYRETGYILRAQQDIYL